jgi:hypothetical protein
MLEGLPLCLWPDSLLWQVRAGILRNLPRVGPCHAHLVGEQWLEAIDCELEARGFRVWPWWKEERGEPSTPRAALVRACTPRADG